MSIRVRFAPSPTGSLHLGAARTAVVNWLIARSSGGTYLLRLDDTDQARSSETEAQAILEDLRWMGVDWDEGPLRQSERADAYGEALSRLVESELAYSESGAVHVRVPPDRSLGFDDELRGRVDFPPGSKEDFVARRSDGTFTYNFATAVDDYLLEVTHVVRGEDHISNTPLQRLVIQGLGAEPPTYLHLPLLLGADGAKLSKRHGATAVAVYRDQGYIAEALLNYLALISFSPPEGEVLSPEELVSSFETSRLHHSAARFDLKKLRWLSGQHIRRLESDDFAARIKRFIGREQPAAVLVALKTAGATLAEAAEAATLFDAVHEPDAAAREALADEGAGTALKAFAEALDRCAASGDPGEGMAVEGARRLLKAVRDQLAERGVAPRVALRAIRAALTGTTSGPELPYFIAALPRREILSRVNSGIEGRGLSSNQRENR